MVGLIDGVLFINTKRATKQFSCSNYIRMTTLPGKIALQIQPIDSINYCFG